MFKPREIKIRLSRRELKEALKKASSRKSVRSKYNVIWKELEDARLKYDDYTGIKRWWD